MARTQVRGSQVLDTSIGASDLNISTPGEAVATKIVAGDGIAISGTGADAGTGVVTISQTTPWVELYKVTDEPRLNTTTLADDAVLAFLLNAVGTWHIMMRVYPFCASANPDFKYAMAFTGTIASGAFYRTHTPLGSTASTDIENVAQGLSPAGSTGVGSTAMTATTSGIGRVLLELYLTITSTGVLSFQWAQNSADAVNVTYVLGISSARYRRVL